MAGNVRGSRSIGEKDWKPHNVNVAANQYTTKLNCTTENDWKPHNVNVTSNEKIEFKAYTKPPGPDWTSSLRCYGNTDLYRIGKMKPCAKEERDDIHNITKPLSPADQSFPKSVQKDINTWSYYAAGCKFGKRCVIDGVYMSNKESNNHMQLENVIGKRNKVSDCRGCLPVRSPGDKSYYVPEYSKDFHKEGSTLPAVDFSHAHEPIEDTFIPLQPLPATPSLPYKYKEAARLLAKEKADVEKLDDWMPAPPLQAKFQV